MSNPGLYELYRLHLIDSKLHELQNQANALDGGKAILNKIEALKQAHSTAFNGPKVLQEEIAALEGKLQLWDSKIKEIDKKLYGGAVVNPREIQGYEAEIKEHKQWKSEAELRILELMDALPAAESAAAVVRGPLQKLAKEFKEKQASDQARAEELKAAYKRVGADRPGQLSAIPKPLLDQYELIRKKYGGIGMGIINGNVCGACGTELPTRIVAGVETDKVITCESCHRILFKVVAGS